MRYLNLSVQACVQQRAVNTKALKRDLGGRVPDPSEEPAAPIAAPFGPHVIPVPCDPRVHGAGSDDGIRPGEAQAKRAKLLSEPSTDRPARPDPLGAPQRAEGSRGDIAEQSQTQGEGHEVPITTNDLLDCLVHPDVITRVAQLLLEKQRLSGTTPPHHSSLGQ